MKATELKQQVNNWSEEDGLCLLGQDTDSSIDFERQMIHLLWGKSSSGKTTTCLKISQIALQNDMNVLYWDTETGLRKSAGMKNGFINQILEEEENSKGGFYTIGDMPNQDTFLDSLDDLEDVIKDKDIDVVVIDSIIAPVTDMHPNNRSRLFKKLFKKLKRITTANNVITVATTHTTSTSKKSKFNGEQVTIDNPIGGNAMLHYSDYKYYLKDWDKANQSNDDWVRVIYNIAENYGVKVRINKNNNIMEADQ